MAITTLNLSPADGSIIDPDELVQVDVKSATHAFRRIVITFGFDGYQFREVAYEGDPVVDGQAGYEELYSASSSISTMESGPDYRYRFIMRRSLLWPASPQMGVVAFNVNGEEL